MKKYLFLVVVFLTVQNSIAAVDFFGNGFIVAVRDPSSCKEGNLPNVGIHTNWESNNYGFQFEKSMDPNFTWAIISSQFFQGWVDGCGTCSGRTYSLIDYSPTNTGEVWYYRVKAKSNNDNYSDYKEIGHWIVSTETVVNWTSQVTSTVTVASTPQTESSYNWSQEFNEWQGVTISLLPIEVNKIYLEENNNKISFNTNESNLFSSFDVRINGYDYFNIYNGNFTNSFVWHNSSTNFHIGQNSLKVRFQNTDGIVFIREYIVIVVPKSDNLYYDNYCNTIREWKGNDPVNGTPIILSEGFDAYNTKSEQYYRYAGQELINCLLNKGFNVFVINYKYNSQSISNNAAVFQAAIRYVSSINSNKKIIAAGMSMGGIINRLACAKAEHDGNPLPISHFLSMDAPQQGAIISQELQEFRHTNTDDDDLFAKHALDNDAAKELLLYNTYTTFSSHVNFFNYLNALNGDGYPHLSKNVGVAFSTTSPNPNSGVWLSITIPSDDVDISIATEELVAGSFLPDIKVDPSNILGGNGFESAFFSFIRPLFFLRPFIDLTVQVNQTSSPTFIPHTSALDIVNGFSKFDKTIITGSTTNHDVVPSDIVESLMNELLPSVVYVQNKTYNNELRTIIANEEIFVGSNVDPNQVAGNVIINSNSFVTFKAGSTVNIQTNGITGTNYHIVIDQAKCDGSLEYQTKTINNNESSIIDIYTPPNNLNQTIVYRADDDLIIFKEDIVIFPNPAENLIFIESIIQDTQLIGQLSTLEGKLINTFLIDKEVQEVDISNFENGIYILKLFRENMEVKKTKIVKI